MKGYEHQSGELFKRDENGISYFIKPLKLCNRLTASESNELKKSHFWLFKKLKCFKK